MVPQCVSAIAAPHRPRGVRLGDSIVNIMDNSMGNNIVNVMVIVLTVWGRSMVNMLERVVNSTSVGTNNNNNNK